MNFDVTPYMPAMGESKDMEYSLIGVCYICSMCLQCGKVRYGLPTNKYVVPHTFVYITYIYFLNFVITMVDISYKEPVFMQTHGVIFIYLWFHILFYFISIQNMEESKYVHLEVYIHTQI